MVHRYRFKKTQVKGIGRAALATCKLLIGPERFSYFFDVVLAATDESIFPTEHIPWLSQAGQDVINSSPILLTGTATKNRYPWRQLPVKLAGAEGEKYPTGRFNLHAYFCDEALRKLKCQQGGWVAAIGRSDLKDSFTVSETYNYLYLDVPDPTP
jgi:hypothetical protein